MNIKIQSLLEGARNAAGAVVIIDVFRAFTTAAYALAQGARKLILVEQPEEALALKRDGVGDLCMGEVGGCMPDGFDLGNSPEEVAAMDLHRKTIIHTTRAGTVGVCAVPRDAIIFAASLVVASATARKLAEEKPALVTLVPMGSEGRYRTDEDELCALYIRNLLEGRNPDTDALVRLILDGGEAGKFGDPARPCFRKGDLGMALAVDAFDFAMPVRREDGLMVLRSSAESDGSNTFMCP